MDAAILRILKESRNRIVKISCSDGEVFLGKVLVVSDEDEDVVYDLVSTNRPEQYDRFGRDCAYRVKLEDILSVETA